MADASSSNTAAPTNGGGPFSASGCTFGYAFGDQGIGASINVFIIHVDEDGEPLRAKERY